MSAAHVTLEIPAELYAQLEELAAEESTQPVKVIERLVAAAQQHRVWLRDVTALREQIQRDGGLAVGATKDEVVERLRQTRRDIFDAKYAHLYR